MAHFGHNPALHMVRQAGCDLISKLRRNSALYFLTMAPIKDMGRIRSTVPRWTTAICRCGIAETTTEKDICTETPSTRCSALHKQFAQTLNVVIMVKTNP